MLRCAMLCREGFPDPTAPTTVPGIRDAAPFVELGWTSFQEAPQEGLDSSEPMTSTLQTFLTWVGRATELGE